MSAVYVLHFDPPYLHAGHYIGFTEHEDVAQRLEEHLAGRGSPLIRAAVANGSRVEIAHVFVNGSRGFERRIKNMGSAARWCRLCGKRERPTPSMARSRS